MRMPKVFALLLAFALMLGLLGCEPFEVDPYGEFIFVANGIGNTLDVVRVDPETGAVLGGLGTGQSLSYTPQWVAADPSGRFIYVVSREEGETPGKVSVYALDRANGTLTQQTDTITWPLGTSFESAVVDPSGRFLYLADSNWGIYQFAISSTDGTLSIVNGGMPISAGTSRRLVIHPSGKLLYSVDFATGQLLGFAISVWDGSLSPLPGYPVTISETVPPSALAMDRTGKLLFVALDGSPEQGANLLVYRVDESTGSVSPASPASTRVQTRMIHVDHSGSYLYATVENGVEAFRIDTAAGTLTPVTGSPFAARGTTEQVITNGIVRKLVP